MDHLMTPQGRRIALHRVQGRRPGVLFLGGYRSDMEGTKALTLDAWARAEGRGFVRFDYSGHGRSEGRFEDGSIGDWAEDAKAVLATTEGPQVLVGSSMGGWIALLLARDMPGRVAGLVTLAAAPDFTEDIRQGLSDAESAALQRDGSVRRPSDYGDADLFTQRLLDDGARRLVLRDPLRLACPVRCLQGTDDTDVPVATALRLLRHAEADDMRLILVKGADHRFSTPDCLALMTATVGDVMARVKDA